MTKARPSTQMVVFGIEDEWWFPVDRYKRGDPQGVLLLPICYASRWHEEVPRSSSLVLLERDEETRRGLYSKMSPVSVYQGRTSKANMATLAIQGG